MRVTKRAVSLIFLAAALGGSAYMLSAPPPPSQLYELGYSEFLRKAERGEIKYVSVHNRDVFGGMRADFYNYHTYAPPSSMDSPAARLHDAGVNVRAGPPVEVSRPWYRMLLEDFGGFVMMAFLFGVLSTRMSAVRGAWQSVMGSRAKLVPDTGTKTTFDDVAGVDEAKADLQDIVEFLRDPEKFENLGGRAPRGVLLVGPPGSGKTHIARAVAGEANVPFYVVSGSDFIEMFAGLGAARVRDMFAQAKKSNPCIIFIDEIDSIGRARAKIDWGGNERDQALNQLLVEMDGIEQDHNIILIAATNRPDTLDKALTRKGRFDREINVPYPDLVGREEILKVRARTRILESNVNWQKVARATPGFSGADLENLVNEAALLAARRDKKQISDLELEDARNKILMGVGRQSASMTDEEKFQAAYREGAKALVSLVLPGCDPVHRVSILQHGTKTGMTTTLAERDRLSDSRERMKSRLVFCLAGRAAEEMHFKPEHVTSAAAADLQTATHLAQDMVTQWGLSQRLGVVQYGESEGANLGAARQTVQRRTQNFSKETSGIIDAEVKNLVHAAKAQAMEIVLKHGHALDILVRALYEHETLNNDQIRKILPGLFPSKPFSPSLIQ